MTIINITDFKRNIGTYFDDLISRREPIIIQRRRHTALMISLDDLTQEEIETISNIKNRKNFDELKDKSWLDTFSKLQGQKLDKVILG